MPHVMSKNDPLFPGESDISPQLCASGPRVFYLATRPHLDVVTRYFRTWGRTINPCFQVVPYEDVLGLRRLPPGTYVFSDIERLGPVRRALVADLHRQLREAGDAYRVLNDPARVRSRYRLLRGMFESGQNDFNAYPLSELPRPPARPLFLRHAFEHAGSFTQLLSNGREVNDAVATLMMQGFRPDDLLGVEYLDTRGSDGLYRKYSYFRVGDEYIPRHLIFGQHWVLRYPDLVEDHLKEEEWAFLTSTPHLEAVKAAFDYAEVEYGRVDYAVSGSRIQVWEINTHPIIMMRPADYAEDHLPAQEYFASLIREALLGLCPDQESSEQGIAPQVNRDVLWGQVSG